MGSSAWMELETLSNEIADSQGRLEAAKSVGSDGLVQVLEQEIAQLEERRTRILANIATSVIGSADSGQQPAAADAVEQRETNAAVENADEENAETEQRSAVVARPKLASGFATPARASRSDQTEGATNVWNQLSKADFERAKQDLDLRRAEVLARHAEELRSLDTDQAEIDTLEQAIDAFARKFNLQPAGGEVVRLEPGRESRRQGTG